MKNSDAKPGITPEMALSRAMKLCSRQEYCTADVAKKLAGWQVDPQHIPGILEHLKKEKFLDDFRFARAYAKDKLRFAKWGLTKIRYQLKMKGLSESVITEVFQDLDEIDQNEIIRKELENKRRQIREDDPYKLKMKLFRFAQGRGYDLSVVAKILGDIND